MSVITSPVIKANNIHLRVKGKTIINDVSLVLSPGDFHVLLGPNGAGKSSLLNVMSGDKPVSDGQVLYNDRLISHWSLKDLSKTRAVLPQLNLFMFPMSVFEVCALGRTPFIRSNLKSYDREIIAQVLTQLDLIEYRERDYSQLSGGEKQRVQIARILCQQTPVIFFDEPLNALDIMHQLKVLDLMKSLSLKGRSILCVMHDVNLALRYATSLSVLKAGSLLFQGTPSQLKISRKLDEALNVESYECDSREIGFRLFK